MNHPNTARWSRLAVPIAIVGLVVAACSGGGATSPQRRAVDRTDHGAGQRSRQRAGQRTRQRPGERRRGGSCAAPTGTVHVSIVNKDMSPRRDQGRDRRGRQPGRRQLDLHGQRRAGQAVPEVRQEHVRRRHQADLRGQPGAERLPDRRSTPPRRRATRRRTTSWPSRRTTGPTAIAKDAVDSYLPSGLVPNQNLVLTSSSTSRPRSRSSRPPSWRSSTTRTRSPSSSRSWTWPTRGSRAR